MRKEKEEGKAAAVLRLSCGLSESRERIETRDGG